MSGHEKSLYYIPQDMHTFLLCLVFVFGSTAKFPKVSYYISCFECQNRWYLRLFYQNNLWTRGIFSWKISKIQVDEMSTLEPSWLAIFGYQANIAGYHTIQWNGMNIFHRIPWCVDCQEQMVRCCIKIPMSVHSYVRWTQNMMTWLLLIISAFINMVNDLECVLILCGLIHIWNSML